MSQVTHIGSCLGFENFGCFLGNLPLKFFDVLFHFDIYKKSFIWSKSKLKLHDTNSLFWPVADSGSGWIITDNTDAKVWSGPGFGKLSTLYTKFQNKAEDCFGRVPIDTGNG